MPDIDESQLIDASLQGNSAAFGELVQIHQNRLFNAMSHFCGNATEAEDVVQEAFIQAYTKLAKFQQNSQFYTWLYRIAFNTAISRKRRKRVETSIDKARDDIGIEPVDEGDAPGEQMMREEQATQVHQALGKLTEEHRSILVLREMEDCDYEQIAEILDINVGTVRSRLHRARLQLRDRLQEM